MQIYRAFVNSRQNSDSYKDRDSGSRRRILGGTFQACPSYYKKETCDLWQSYISVSLAVIDPDLSVSYLKL